MKKVLYIFLITGNFYLLNAVQMSSVGYSNIRKEASLTAEIVGVLKKDEKVNILDTINTKGRYWCQIPKGYVSCKLLKIDKIKETKTKKKVVSIPTKLPNKNNKSKKTDNFSDAKKAFLNKEYKKAYDSFYQIFLNNLDNPNINFYLGRSAFMLGRFDEAISAYERVLFIDENATRVKLELARCHMANNSDELAKTIFLEILKTEIPQNVRINIKKNLEILENKKVRNTFSGIFIVGVGWDDNIESLSTNYISEVTDSVFTSTNSLQSAWTHQEMLALNHTYKYSDTIDIKNNALFFMKNHAGFSQRNIQFIQFFPALSFKYSNQLSVDYTFIYNRVLLDRKSLISNYAFHPKLQFINSKSLILEASLKYQKKSNDDSNNKDRDAMFYETSLNAQVIHTDKLSTTNELKYAQEKKIRGVLTDVDYNLYSLSTAAVYKFTDDLSVSLKAKLFHKSYLEKYIPTKNKRVDNEYQGYFSTTYMLSKKNILQAEYIYTDHQSNYNDFEFKKNTFTINFISMF